MGSVAVFNYELWNANYREFSNVTQVQAQLFWNEACLQFRNDGGGPIDDPTMQATLLNMLTAHIAFVRVGTNGNPSPASQGLVGRVSSATQGSVSISTDLPQLPGTAAYYATSPYGLAFFNATAPFRTMNYRANQGRRFPW
jgi:hypothetical protein